MGLHFCIYRRGTFGRPELAISAERFQELSASVTFSARHLAIEELYDLMLTNFLDFLSSVHRAIAEYTIRPVYGWELFASPMAAMNRTLSNLLSSTRAYLDQVRSVASESEREALYTFIAKQYDTHLGYRVLEALRNYCQHCGLPIQALAFNREAFESKAGDRRLVSTGVPQLSPDVILGDKNFKRSVAAELEKANSWELVPFVKEYVGALSEIQDLNRSLHMQEQKRLAARVHAAWSEYADLTPDRNITDLVMFREDAEGKILEAIPLNNEISKALERFRGINRKLSSLKMQDIHT